MLHINKHEVCLIENQKLGTNIEVIKSYIHSTLSNIAKTGLSQLLGVAFVDRHMNQIIKITENPLINDRLRMWSVSWKFHVPTIIF